MSKNGTYKCANCGTQYNKKLIKCPQCNSVNERKMEQVAALEIKASHAPETGLQCKHCGTIFPDDITKCPYCTHQTSDAKRLFSANIDAVIETPVTQYYRKSGYTLKPSSSGRKSAHPDAQAVLCAICKNSIASTAETCPHCGHTTGVRVCPKCGGTQTKVISGASKATSILLWGPFAANKVLSRFQCKDCGYKF